MRLVALLLASALLIGAALTACARPGSPGARPRLIADDSVADDLRALAQETWARFLVAFAGRTDCFGDVRLTASFDLTDRAAYDPRQATVTVRVPGTAAMLQSALIHEWAHHVEHQCPAHRELRPAFLAAQGISPDTPWRLDNAGASAQANAAGPAWADTPSEQYAEAAIEVVLGHRPIPTTAHVRPAAVEVLAAWAAGR
jgi:hypothetical protein